MLQLTTPVLSADDGHTNFGDDSTVSFIVALSDGVFSNGDTVSLYREGETSTLKTVRVGIRRGQADADGESSFVFEISKSRFTEGSFKLYASYVPRLSSEDVAISSRLALVYDTTAPAISITHADIQPASSKVISAADRDTEESTWVYRQMLSDTTCNAVAMAADTKAYVEGY